VGLLIIPAKRRRAKSDLHDKLEDLRQRLMASMTEEFERELSRSLQRLRAAIASLAQIRTRIESL
jgi:chaperonin cofactor prefoldin